MTTFNIPIVDHSVELSTTRIPVIATETDPNLTALFNAVTGISIGNAGQATLMTRVNKDNLGGGRPAEPFAVRALKWLIDYHDAVTGEKAQMEIGTARTDGLAANSDQYDPANPGWTGFVAAFETHVKFRGSGNAVVIDAIKLVGRNL